MKCNLPTAQLKPDAPHDVAVLDGSLLAQHLLEPEVMSLNGDELVPRAEYNVGLSQPTELFPTAKRWALINDIKPAKTGEEQEVPNCSTICPPIIT